jgi:hypothetical protein
MGGKQPVHFRWESETSCRCSELFQRSTLGVTIPAQSRVRQQLAIMAIKQDRAQAALLADALNLLFERHEEAPIAKA